MKKKTLPPFYSLAVKVNISLPVRAEILPKIESGELEHIDFPATVFQNGPLRAPFEFREQDLPAFAKSFEGLPFIRNHDVLDIEARDGTILSSEMIGNTMHQTIRLTTRRGMTAFVEGQIDRFSIAWHYPPIVLCSICQKEWLGCGHMPGRKYQNKPCLLICVEPNGKECSAVNDPASDGTGLLSSFEEYKLEVLGTSAVTHAPRASQLSKTKGGLTMKKKVKVNTQVENADGVLETVEVEGVLVEPNLQEQQIEANQLAAAQLLGETQRQQAMDAQLQTSKQTLVAMCEHLLTVGLSTSRLPDVMQAEIRDQFKERTFEASELSTAISKKRDVLTALTSADNVQGPGRITGMYSAKDDFALAVADLFEVPREEGQEKRKVHKLDGLLQAYKMATGDAYFTGGYFPEFALVSANFPGIVANVQNKILTAAWEDLDESYGWWKKVVTVEHFTNLKTATWVRTGTIGSLPSVAERGEYTELPIGDIKETSEWGKYGGYIPLTIESVINDDLRAFKRMPRELALAGMRLISEQVAAIFTQASGAGPTMTDGGALFNATAQTTAGGHANLLTTALGTTYVAWAAVALAMYKKKLMIKNAAGYYGLGKPQALKPSICLVPPDLIDAAEALFIPRWEAVAQNVPATQSVRWGGRVEPLACPEFTDTTDWAALISPKLRPGIMLGEIFGLKPQLFSASSEIDPAMFANDESRIKARQFVTVGVADDLPLHKSNVAGA